MDSKYWDLAAKQLQGKASPVEQEALRQWLAQDPTHAEQFQAQQRLWDLTPPVALIEVDTAFAWQKVKGRLQTAPEKPEPKVIPMYRTLLRVAASVVLLIGLTWMIKLYFFPYYGMQVVRSGNGTLAAMLPDSSQVWLNRNSLLAYDPDFDGDERVVDLEGEAFFEVQRNPLRPFLVQAEAADARVLGTSFNFRAYPAEETVILTVATGKVAFRATEANAEAILTPGFAAALNRQSNEITQYAITNQNAWAWQSGRLRFEGQPLAEVVQELERYYGVGLQLQSEALANCRFTGSFAGAALEEVLQVLQVTLQLEYRKQNNNTYTLSGEGCQ
ncbi:FecR family protein [Pontibacter pamirensis]|uniref:FecR family protein n=1 Tax=Pontibacter pamirensis TaxID=2562824 RepID=UPI001389777B|nr:FecR domain-containing protein [Pontibacter pamirensis]